MQTMILSRSREEPRYTVDVQPALGGVELAIVDTQRRWWQIWRRAAWRFRLDRGQVVLLYQELYKHGTRQMILEREAPTPAQEFADDVRRTLVEMYHDEGRVRDVPLDAVMLVGSPEWEDVIRKDAEFVADFLAHKGYRKG